MQMWLTSENTLIQNSKSSMIEFHSKWMIFSLTFSQDHSIFFILTQESEHITNTHFNIVIATTIQGFKGVHDRRELKLVTICSTFKP